MRHKYGRNAIVPIKDQNLMVESDENRIKQVLMNLQSNALKFTKQGGKVSIIAEYLPAVNPAEMDSPARRQQSIEPSEEEGEVSDQSGLSQFEREHKIDDIIKPQ